MMDPHIFSPIVHLDRFMNGAFPGSWLLDGFLHTGDVWYAESKDMYYKSDIFYDIFTMPEKYNGKMKKSIV